MSSDAKIEVRWEVDMRGGRCRTHTFELDLEDLGHCESEVEYERALDSFIQQEFQNVVGWYCDNYTDVIAAAKLYNSTEDE